MPPKWPTLRVFLLGLLWQVLLSSGPIAWTIWSWLTNPYDNSISWRQLLGLYGVCAGPALAAYWRKHKAMLEPPEGTNEQV